MTTFPRNAQGVDFQGEPLALLRRGVFPDDWAMVPVHGKDTYVKKWTSVRLSRDQLIEAYKGNSSYRGLGVVTGSFSGGLLALDIDGPKADERYRQVAGDEYEAYGEESTMSWTSGRPGRRQLLYQVPAGLVDQLREVRKVILRMDGTWALGQGDTERGAGGEKTADGEAYEEVVLRFNGCQSVLPGSPHPVTHKPYTFLNYNRGAVGPAPRWVISVLLGFSTPVQWLDAETQAEIEAELGGSGMLPPKQARGWFFKEDVLGKLMPRAEELVFNDEVFSDYGWKDRDGDPPQRLSGCPWHGGSSGTSFQYNLGNGNWYCHACAVGGDLLDYIHKQRKRDIHAERPAGETVVTYIAELATKLGYDFPACAKAVEVTTRETPLKRLTGPEFFQAAQKIIDGFDNAELAHYYLMELVRDCGLGQVYKSGPQVEAAVERFIAGQQQQEGDPDWQAKARGKREYLIPDFMSKPSLILLHARGGMGKTRLAVLLSRIIGRKEPIKVRGLMVEPTTSGNVLFIGTDMSEVDYAEYLDQQGIDSSGADTWFHFRSQWQQSQYRVLLRWLQEYKPVLVVIDSLTSVSTMVASKENEREYSNTLYRLARENGSMFPPTNFLIVHHNTKDGSKFRGTDTLRNAVHETWELLEPTEEQRAEYGDRSMILKIDKCRGQRSGDCFLVREDIEEALSIEDLTPTVARENQGRGDEKPRTMLLGLLKDATEPMTLKELRWRLNEQISGRRARGIVSRATVQRWVQSWVASGLVEPAEVRPVGQKGGRPSTAFRVKTSYYEPPSEQNLPPFFEIRSGAVDPEDEVLLTGMSKTPLSTTADQNLEGVSPENDETDSEACAAQECRPNEVTQTGAPPSSVEEADHLLNQLTDPPVSKTSSPETLSTPGISENEGEVLLTRSLVKEDATPRWELGDIADFDLG